MSGPRLCGSGKPFVAYPTKGQFPLRIQAECEGWGECEVSPDGCVTFPDMPAGEYRIAVYCCTQHPVVVFASCWCPEGATLNGQLGFSN